MNKSISKKNLRRLSALITAQTDYHLEWMAAIYGKDKGWVINKLVREKMLSLRCETEKCRVGQKPDGCSVQEDESDDAEPGEISQK